MADTRSGPPFFYKAGLHNVGSYQVSGRPWITGSDAHVAPGITGTTTVANKHYFPLEDDKDAYTFNTKCTDVYISTPSGNARIAKWRIVAELTGIQASSMFELTGSGITE